MIKIGEIVEEIAIPKGCIVIVNSNIITIAKEKLPKIEDVFCCIYDIEDFCEIESTSRSLKKNIIFDNGIAYTNKFASQEVSVDEFIKIINNCEKH